MTPLTGRRPAPRLETGSTIHVTHPGPTFTLSVNITDGATASAAGYHFLTVSYSAGACNDVWEIMADTVTVSLSTIYGRALGLSMAVVTTVAACGHDQVVCPHELPVINVRVRDAVTTAPAAAGATGLIESGDFLAELHAQSDGLTLAAILGPPGGYRVTVQKPAYQDWQRDIPVGANVCGTRSVRLDASIQPIP